MTWMRTALRTAREDRTSEDAGFSLMETLVATSIFAVFMSLVMMAMVAMLSSTQKSTSLSDGAAAVENAFQKLDHQVRYSDAIHVEGKVGNNWFIEWHTPATSTSAALCQELKYDSTADKLLERSWAPAPAVSTPTSWLTLAVNIVNDPNVPAQNPFTFVPTSVQDPTDPTKLPLAHQQLKLYLIASPNGTVTARSAVSETQVSFTALNSSKTSSGVICQEVARS
jgi:prepilin-type N-terminal cleavage/methylation domain-containing protein